MMKKFSIYETTYNSNHSGTPLDENLKTPIHKRAPLSDKITYTAEHKEHHLETTVSDHAIGFNRDGNGTYSLVHPSSKYRSEGKSSFANHSFAPNIEHVHQQNREHLKSLEHDLRATMALPKDDPETLELMNIYKSTTHSHHDRTKVFTTNQPETIIYRDQQQRGKVKTGFKSFTDTNDMSAPSSKHLVENLDIQAKVYPQSFSATSNFGMIPTSRAEYNQIDEKLQESVNMKERTNMRASIIMEKNKSPINEHYVSEQKSQFAAKDPENYRSIDKTFVKPQVFSYRIDSVNGTPSVKPSYTQPPRIK